MRELRATYLFDPEDVAAGWTIMRITAGYEGDLLILSREHPPPAPPAPREQPSRHRVDRWCQGQISSVVLSESTDWLFHTQTLPTNRWLVVKGRAKSEQDANARVYDAEGHMRHSFHAGDGIQDVQTTRDGRIWVSYHDEGVFGDLPLGEAGLVCFDSEGRLQFQYNSFAKGCGLPAIDSCYALNVATTADIWVYYSYSKKYPLVNLRGTELAHHCTNVPVYGWNAFAVAEGQVLLRGGYKQHDRLFLVSLDPTAAEEVNVVDDRGDAVPVKPTYNSCFGRAERFYIVADRGLFVIDLRELGLS